MFNPKRCAGLVTSLVLIPFCDVFQYTNFLCRWYFFLIGVVGLTSRSAGRPLHSFPWLAWDVLAQIKLNNQNLNSNIVMAADPPSVPVIRLSFQYLQKIFAKYLQNEYLQNDICKMIHLCLIVFWCSLFVFFFRINLHYFLVYRPVLWN